MRLAAAIVSFAFLSAMLLGFVTTPARASGIPVVDGIGNIINNLTYVEDAMTAVQQYAGTFQQFYEWEQSFALSALKANLTQGLQDKIFKYVSGGGDTPKFVTDWKNYAEKARTSGIAEATKKLSSSGACSSFSQKLFTSIGATEAGSGNGAGILKCDFEPGELEKIADDPSKGGWADYLKAAKPKNNLIGATLLAHDVQQKAADAAEEAAINEATAGGGYLGAKDGGGKISTPGSTLKDLTSKALGADFDLIANAEQLQNIIGSISGSVINNLSKSGDDDGGDGNRGDKGIKTGIDFEARQRARNGTRDASGTALNPADTVPDCNLVFMESLSADQKSAFSSYDADANSYFDANEIDKIIADNGSEVETGLFDLCLKNANAGNGNQQLSVDATVNEVNTKRKQAQKALKELTAEVARTRNSLNSYVNNNTKWTKKAQAYKVDNPIYNPTLTADSLDAARFQYLYLARGVNWRKCFKLDTTTIKYLNRKPGSANDIGTIDYAYVTAANPADTAIDYFVPGVTPTANPAAGAKTNRCTVDVRNADGELIEAAYYGELIKKVELVDAANDLAVKKITALKKMLESASKTKPVGGINQKAMDLVTDFKCHGSPFSCAIPDTLHVGGFKYPGPQLTRPANIDADENSNEPGYYDAENGEYILDGDGEKIWKPTPSHLIVDQIEYGRTERDRQGNERVDYYGTIIENPKLNLDLTVIDDCEPDPTTMSATQIAAIDGNASCIARRGLISTINGDNLDDDPANPYYDPAFDLAETNRVYDFSQGNLDILGNLESPDETEIADENPDA